MPKDPTATSELISLLLRHKPEVGALTLDRGGWVSVQELLNGMDRAGHPITREELARIVAGSDKQRFELSRDGRSIRACQGHSLPVNLGYADRQPPETLYHGTAASRLASILAEGIDSRKRHAVHLSADVETATAVGARFGKPVVLTVDAGRMHREGHRFQCSTNGVWLTEHVPPKYLSPPETAHTSGPHSEE